MKHLKGEKRALPKRMPMSAFFDVSEILQHAIRIEENGEKFYRYAVRLVDNEDAQALFNMLAEEEVHHKKTFENLLSTIEARDPRESYPGEYAAYLRAFVDTVVFTDDALQQQFSTVKDTRSALNFGIQRERDSILYFLEMKKFVPKGQHPIIDRITDEERKHFARLSKLRENLQ